MTYLIDGYNLIFSLIESKESLQKIRSNVITELQKLFTNKGISGTIVFDGAHRREEESGLSYSSPLTIAYAPKGQSADEYILEKIEASTKIKQIIVVTNDKGLIRHVRSAGAKVLANEQFISWLKKKKRKKQAVEPKETKENFERLLKIFEEKFHKDV